MENLTRILEIKEKGPETATIDDIPLVFKILRDFVNENPEAQKLIKGLDLSLIIKIEGAEPYYLTIENGIAEFGKGILDSPDFTLKSDLLTISKLLLGQIDATEAFFSGAFKTEGDLYYMILFLEILELAFRLLNIADGSQSKVLITTDSMKKLFDVYARGVSTVEASHVPLFFEVLTAFVNLNPEAQKIITGEDVLIQMTTTGVGDFLLRIVDNKMGWSRGTHPGATVKLEMNLRASTDLIFSGDAVSSFMEGKIRIQGSIANALLFQEINQLFVEQLNLG